MGDGSSGGWWWQYQTLESQSLSATWNNISSHITVSALHKIAQKMPNPGMECTTVYKDPLGPLWTFLSPFLTIWTRPGLICSPTCTLWVHLCPMDSQRQPLRNWEGGGFVSREPKFLLAFQPKLFTIYKVLERDPWDSNYEELTTDRGALLRGEFPKGAKVLPCCLKQFDPTAWQKAI